MSLDEYLGIDTIYQAEYKQGGSKFISYLFPVADIASFEKKIKQLKMEFADATHVCSACVIGISREYQKFSDDGEPNNSAGRPILHALLSKNISFVGCAVIRYFGGKKLGIPGLIEAYGTSAEICLLNAQFNLKVIRANLRCKIAPAHSYLLYNLLSKLADVSYHVENEIFVLTFPKSMTNKLQDELKNIPTLAVIENEN